MDTPYGVTERQRAERLQSDRVQKRLRREGEGKLAAECVHAAEKERGIGCCTRQSCESDEIPPKGGCGIVVDEVTSALV